MIANRILSMLESATLAMKKQGDDLSQQGFDIIDLSIGEPDFNTPNFIKEEAKRMIDNNVTRYSPVPGYKDVRQAIVKKLQRDNQLEYKCDQIVVSTGAKQALANIILCMVNPGDEVILPAPFWVSYTELVKLADGIPVCVNTTVDTEFKATPQQIEEAITSKTKLIMFNSPNNPSGSIYTYNEAKAIAELLAKYPDIYIVSDEIYELINFSGQHVSFAQFPEIQERVIVINGVSKGFAMTGWRLGYSASSAKIAEAAGKLQGQITSGTNSITQKAVIAALDRDPKDIEEVQTMNAVFKKRRDLFYNLLKNIPGIKINLPEGAFYVFPNFTAYYGKKFEGKIVKDDVELSMYLLNHAHVSTVPGGAFGNGNCIRLSYATSDDKLIEATRRIKAALEKLI